MQFAFLSGETSIPCTPATGSGTTGNRRVEDGGVSRGHSTAEVKAGRPEPVECSSTAEPQRTPVTPHGRDDGLEDSDGKNGGAQENLLEQILSRENMLRAWKRVKANKGAAGMDGMSIQGFPEFTRKNWERIRSALERGAYRPAAVLRVMIPKPTGGQRPLGIPTVIPYCTSYCDLSECCRSSCFSLYDVAIFSRNSTSLLEVSVIQKG